MPELSLYELTVEAAELADALIATGGELTPELEERYDRLHGKDLPAKAEACVQVLRTLEAEADAYKREAETLAAKAVARNKSAKSLKDRLKKAIEAAGVEKLKAGMFELALQKDSRPAISPEDPANPPAEFTEMKLVFSRDLAYRHFKQTGEAPGCVVVQGRHLRIK